MQEWRAATPVEQREHGHHGPSPAEQSSHDIAQCRLVSLAIVPSGQCFACVGKAIHEVAEEREQLHEQCVDGQCQCPLCRTGRSEVEVDGHETQRAQEDVAVDGEETVPGERAVGWSGFRRWLRLVGLIGYRPSQQEAKPLGHYRTCGYARDTQAEPEDQRGRDGNVDDVLRDGHHHGSARVLHADEPARQRVESQHGGCSPDADVEVGQAESGHIGGRLHEPERQGA